MEKLLLVETAIWNNVIYIIILLLLFCFVYLLFMEMDRISKKMNARLSWWNFIVNPHFIA